MSLLTKAIVGILLLTGIRFQTFGQATDSFPPGTVWTFPQFFFELGSDSIRDNCKMLLDLIAKDILKQDSFKVEVGVHTDERFNEEYSTCLSCKRAETLRNYLILRGIPANSIVANGYNGTDPVIQNAQTEEEHQQNRRVTIRFLSQKRATK